MCSFPARRAAEGPLSAVAAAEINGTGILRAGVCGEITEKGEEIPSSAGGFGEDGDGVLGVERGGCAEPVCATPSEHWAGNCVRRRGEQSVDYGAVGGGTGTNRGAEIVGGGREKERQGGLRVCLAGLRNLESETRQFPLGHRGKEGCRVRKDLLVKCV